MSEECMFLENGKCLCEKRYYETSKCPDCEKISNCYYKRAVKAEKTVSLMERLVWTGFKMVKVFSEYKLQVKGLPEIVSNKLHTTLLNAVTEMEKKDDEE